MSTVSFSWMDDVKTDCPIFSPSPEEFSVGLSEYFKTLDLGHSTACLVNPPSTFTVTQQDYSNLDDLIIPTAVTQTIHSTHRDGFFLFSSKDGPRTWSVHRILHSKQPISPDSFWSGLSARTTRVYGADFPMSLFGENDHLWQLNSLTYLFDRFPHPMPGISTPFVYFGSAGSCFPMHTEDLDLPYVNFLHAGCPKVWYVVHRTSTHRLLSLAARLDQELIPRPNFCKNVLRHKDMLLTPALLSAEGISFDTIVQTPGQFVIGDSFSFHEGFNSGFNLAEAVNFATDAWIPYGRKAIRCSCNRVQNPLQMPYLDLVAEVSDLKSANIRLQEQNQRLEARFEARLNSLESQFFSQNHPLPTVSPSFLPQVVVPSTSALPIPHSHSLDLPPNRTSPIPSISALPIPQSLQYWCFFQSIFSWSFYFYSFYSSESQFRSFFRFNFSCSFHLCSSHSLESQSWSSNTYSHSWYLNSFSIKSILPSCSFVGTCCSVSQLSVCCSSESFFSRLSVYYRLWFWSSFSWQAVYWTSESSLSIVIQQKSFYSLCSYNSYSWFFCFCYLRSLFSYLLLCSLFYSFL